MRRAAKRDISEPGIVEALEKAGCSVWRDLPVDLLVFRAGRFYALECKTPGLGTHTRERKRQNDFIRLTGCPVVKTPEEALHAITR